MSSGEERTSVFSIRSTGSLILLVVVVALLLWISFNTDVPTPERMREIVLGYGWGGWLVFLGVTAAIAITPIPITVPALVAGSLYGIIEGTVLSLSGVMIGSWLGYWLARLVGQRFTFQLLGRHSEIVKGYLSNAGFWAICTVRLMPGLPYWPVNYGAGALGVGQKEFLSATFLASIPGQISLVTLGAFTVDPSLFRGVVLVISWAAVLTLTLISYRYWRHMKPDTQNEEATEG